VRDATQFILVSFPSSFLCASSFDDARRREPEVPFVATERRMVRFMLLPFLPPVEGSLLPAELGDSWVINVFAKRANSNHVNLTNSAYAGPKPG
jgi:hypothetical protein